MLTEEQFKWASKLIGLDFDIKYRPGKENMVADALSRQVFFNISVLQPQEWDDWDTEIQKDVKMSSIMQNLLVDPTAHAQFQLKKRGNCTIKANLFCLNIIVESLLSLKSFMNLH